MLINIHVYKIIFCAPFSSTIIFQYIYTCSFESSWTIFLFCLSVLLVVHVHYMVRLTLTHWKLFFCSILYNIKLKFISAIPIQYSVVCTTNDSSLISSHFMLHRNCYFKCIIMDIMTWYLHLRQFQASYLDCDQSELWNVFKGMPGGRFYLGGCLGKLCKEYANRVLWKHIQKCMSYEDLIGLIWWSLPTNLMIKWWYKPLLKFKCTYFTFTPKLIK